MDHWASHHHRRPHRHQLPDLQLPYELPRYTIATCLARQELHKGRGPPLLRSRAKALGEPEAMLLPVPRTGDLHSLEDTWRPASHFSTEGEKEVTAQVRGGLEAKQRRQGWFLLSGAAAKRAQGPKYEELVAAGQNLDQEEAVRVIQADLHRTGMEGVDVGALENLLLAFAAKNLKIGYCQSMSFVAATLLMYMEEEQAFWTLCSLLEDILPEDYLSERMLGLFLNTLPGEWSHRVLDSVLYEGSAVLFRCALSILSLREEQLRLILQGEEGEVRRKILPSFSWPDLEWPSMPSMSFSWLSLSPKSETSVARFAAVNSDGGTAAHETSGPSIYGPAASSHSQLDIVFSGISFSHLETSRPGAFGSLAKTTRKPPDPKDLGPGGIYHEKQVAMLCAVHTINNLDKAQLRLTGGRAGDYMNCREDGFYNALVVQAVFSGLGYEVGAIRSTTVNVDDEMAFIANKARHWFACRRLGDGWFDLNSCLSKPEYYDRHDMEEHLIRAEEQGYRLFAIRGDWPLTPLEQDPAALSTAVRGCLRPLGYRASGQIPCTPGLLVMVDGKSKGQKEYRVPRWLGFGAHWFSAARFQHHPVGTSNDWQEAELANRKKKVVTKKKSDQGATLEEADDLEDLESSKKERGKHPLLHASEDTELALEDVPVYRPIFVLVQMTLTILFWLIASLVEPSKDGWIFTVAGLETIIPGKTLCQTTTDCMDERFQAWPGIPLEQFQGHWRIILLYNMGVFTGGILNMVWNPHSSLAGASAGCYALLFAHCAELGMNWMQSRYRWAKLTLIVLVVAFDIVQSSVMYAYTASEVAVVSHTAHMGGACAGLFFGILITRNLVVTRAERIRQVVATIIYLGILGTHFALLAEWPPKAFYNSSDPGWCWARQIFNQTILDDQFHCFRCPDEACIRSWETSQRSKASGLTEAFLFMAYFFLQVGMAFLMKFVLSQVQLSKDLRGVPAPFFVVGTQQLVSFSLMLTFVLSSKLFGRTVEIKKLAWKDFRLVLVLSLAFTVNIGFNLLSMSLIPLPLHLIIRSCSPITTSIMQSVVLREKQGISKPEWCCLFLGVICAATVTIAESGSVGLSGAASRSFWCGVCFCVTSLLLAGLDFVLKAKLGKGPKLNALETNLYNALPVALLALVFGSFLPTPVRLGPWLNRVVVVLWMETGRRPVVETAGRQVGGNLETYRSTRSLTRQTIRSFLPTTAPQRPPTPRPTSLVARPPSWMARFGSPLTDLSVFLKVFSVNAPAYLWVVGSGVCAMVFNLFVTFMVVKLSPATSSFAGNFNKSMSIALSLFLLEGHRPTDARGIIKLCAVFGNIAAFYVYNVLRKKRQQK
eukprot:g27907.t1